LELSGIHLQKKLLCKDFGRVDSKDVMQPRVETLGVQMTLDEVARRFPAPIIAAFLSVDNGNLVIVTQTDLTKMRDRQLTGILKRNYDAPTGDC